MNPYLIISICIIVALIAVFFVTFVINRRTPKPKGCEDIKISEENCSACQVAECSLKNKFDFVKEVEAEIEEEKKSEEE